MHDITRLDQEHGHPHYGLEELFSVPAYPYRITGRPTVAVLLRGFDETCGGGMMSLLRILETARDRGYRILFLYHGRCVGLPEWIQAIRVRRFGLAAALRRLRPSVLFTPTSWAKLPEEAGGPIPCVVHIQFWRSVVKCKPEILRRLDDPHLPESCIDRPGNEILARAAAVVANSDYTASVVERITGRKCDAVVCPTLGGIRTLHAPPVRDRRFVTCPSAQTLKGTSRFFQLARSNPDVDFLLLAGESLRTPGVVEEAEGILNVRIRREWVEDMREIYAQTRALFVGTETGETFCRAAAEARVNGIPLLVLAAGNLPNMITDGGGVAVPRGAGNEKWNNALREVLTMSPPDPTDRFNRDDRSKMIDVFDDVRRLDDVVMPTPTAPGIRQIVLQAARVLGTTAVPWDTPVAELTKARLVVVPWQLRPDLASAGVPTLVWWCSHFAQMDTLRAEYAALVDLVARVEDHPHLGIAFTSQADAAVWAGKLGNRAVWLPACLDTAVEPHPTTNDGVFIPGPYGPRKNVGTALAACARLGVDAYATGKIRGHRELRSLADALGVRLVVEDCDTVEDVRRLAGSCRAAVAVSLAETFGFGPAECVLAGTPTVTWAGIPALTLPRTSRKGWHVTDPTDAIEVAEKLRGALDHPELWGAEQRDTLEAVAERNRKVARRALLDASPTVPVPAG